MELDHLAVAGESLDAAVDYVEEALGVPLQPGGQHEVYGTHNCLLGLADGLYLEAIAKDPNAEPQRRPCWFDLDHFSGGPRISNWIYRCENLAATLQGQPVGAGQVVALSRGDLRWDMAVPEDGILPFDNMFPALIEWHSAHPASGLIQQGCALEQLVISTRNGSELQNLLSLGDARVRYETGAPGFEATFSTPHGRRVLR